MLVGWDDVIARVRGLASRLLGRSALEHLATSRDLATFVNALEGTTYASATDDVDVPAEVERGLRRAAGERVASIIAWCGNRTTSLAPLFEDQDRRNLRALAREIVAQTPIAQRTIGLLATPGLPAAALDELARQTRLADLAAMLVAWNNPYGRAMLDEATSAHPELFALQLAIDRTFAERAVAASRRVGAPLRGYVALQIDAENANTALAAAAGRLEHRDGGLFLPGGETFDIHEWQALATLDEKEARARLARLVAGTPLAPVASDCGADPDGAMLTAMLRDLRHQVRASPLSLAVVLEYVLRLRAELHDLARIVWGITLQVPRRRIAAALVTP